MQIITVSQLNKKIKTTLENNPFFNNLWISGEISNFKHHSSGHLYFTLKDQSSCLRSVMFRSRTQSMLFRPENGMKVIAKGYISVYERDGQYQFYVEEMQPDGVGALHIAFEQLKKHLQEEGLFDLRHKKVLPEFPRKIGLVTSPTGAAVRDILTVLTRRYPLINIILAPVAVQGEQAPDQIAEGVRLLNKFNDIDVIIVGRGGGSLEELWAFNTEVVARSIFESNIPIISAVGHEVDYTISDFVADVRAATPSAAAELAVPDKNELQRYILNLRTRSERAVRGYTSSQKKRVEDCLQHHFFKNPRDIINQSWQQLDYLNKFLNRAVINTHREKKKDLSFIVGKLSALSPLTTLERGFSICQKDGIIVRKAEEVATGDKVQVVLQQGKLICSVEEKED